MQWATAISQAARIEDAIDEALDTIAGDLGGREPDLIAAFASPDYVSHASRLPPHVTERHPGAVLIGCSARGVIGGGREIEHERALSLTAAVLPGVTITPFHLEDDAATWRARIGVNPHEARAFVLLPDPLTCPTDALLRWMDQVYPTSTKIGGMASGGTEPGTMTLYAGKNTELGGAVGIALSGNIEVDTIVAQGCRPIGTPVFATRVEKNAIFELDGQPALTVLESLYKQLPTSDQQLFRQSVFIGLVMDREQQQYRHGDFLIRNIIGVQSDMDALMVAADLVDNQVVQFHVLDAETSAAALRHLLASHHGASPHGALLFSCLSRGTGMYGRSDHDSELFRDQFGDVALGGFFCNGEIGPVGGRTWLHSYTSSFGLFRQRDLS